MHSSLNGRGGIRTGCDAEQSRSFMTGHSSERWSGVGDEPTPLESDALDKKCLSINPVIASDHGWDAQVDMPEDGDDYDDESAEEWALDDEDSNVSQLPESVAGSEHGNLDGVASDMVPFDAFEPPGVQWAYDEDDDAHGHDLSSISDFDSVAHINLDRDVTIGAAPDVTAPSISTGHPDALSQYVAAEARMIDCEPALEDSLKQSGDETLQPEYVPPAIKLEVFPSANHDNLDTSDASLDDTDTLDEGDETDASFRRPLCKTELLQDHGTALPRETDESLANNVFCNVPHRVLPDESASSLSDTQEGRHCGDANDCRLGPAS